MISGTNKQVKVNSAYEASSPSGPGLSPVSVAWNDLV